MEKQTKSRLIWIAAVALLLAAAFFFGWKMKPNVVVSERQTIDSLRSAYVRDSVEYIHKSLEKDSINSVIASAIISKNRQIIELKKSLEKEKNRIINLPADETVELFSESTGVVSSVTVIDKDTNCITPIQGITQANLLINERYGLYREVELLNGKIVCMQDMIDNRNEALNVARGRVGTLTEQYQSSQGVIDRLSKDNEKANKKIKNRNVALGIIGSIAAGGIITAIILK
jgi:hypothetical protein